MNWKAIVDALWAFLANLQGLASAYRLAVLSVLGLILGGISIWAFALRPQTLIVVVIAAVLGYAYGPRFVEWVRGEGV